MKSKSPLLIALIALASLFSSSLHAEASASDPPCTLHAVPGGIACLTDAGDPLVTRLHPSLFAGPHRFQRRDDGQLPDGPFTHEGHTYYAIGLELLRVDPSTLIIQARHRLPAPLSDLDLDTFDPASLPLGGYRDWSSTLANLQDALWLPDVSLAHEPGASNAPPPVDPDTDRALIQTLQERRSWDPTNPFLTILQAEAHQRLGEEDSARGLFHDAAHTPAPSLDLLRVGLRLHYRGLPDLADIAFERSLTTRTNEGITAENVTSMVNASFGALWFAEATRRALRDQDRPAVDRLARAFAAYFPRVEGSLPAAQRLANLLQDTPEAHAFWSTRAEELSSLPGPDRAYAQASRTFDLRLLLQAGLTLSILLSGLLLGLGARRFAPSDLIALAFLVSALLLLPRILPDPSPAMILWADAPLSLTGDALDAPASQAFLSQISPGDARDQLLASPPAAPEPYVDLLDAAFSHHALRGDAPTPSPGLRSDFPWLTSPLHAPSPLGALAVALAVLFNALLLGFIVHTAASRFPRAAARARACIIGAPLGLSFLRLPTLAIFFTGLIALTPARHIAARTTDHSLITYFGLDSLPAPSSFPLAGALLVATAIALHFIGLKRSASPTDPETSSPRETP